MEIVWTDFARESVLDLLLFIRKCWGDTIASVAWGDIQKDIALLENFPEIGPVF
ncbi:type II toxin-antitoxin system RelE/ParE family toxin [Parabacteroides faecis]|uniref:type II toxin-antitoxin system RelE/ParE family toxin n=1 Tax=Parabacteroides TaxID=375288 RepID=UPI000F002389|nr:MULTISPECIES: type II toxin-antitoxin system RelE/ParE family toxin [Parabacteroides]MBC8617235.1 type II toxin-antitoxin system RelE/ParE family toxin [Parabacteroides faecis]RHS01174.1 type II toxin-antitoxin system RelE/ParE family toxin [Parabacteroides sp. AF14-59]